MRDNLGKMAKNYLKITKSTFLGKALCVGMGGGGEVEDMGVASQFLVQWGDPLDLFH